MEEGAQRAYRGVVVDAVAQAAFNEKKWVWVEDKDEGYIAAWIGKEEGENVEVHLNNGLVSLIFLVQFLMAMDRISCLYTEYCVFVHVCVLCANPPGELTSYFSVLL